MCLCDTWHFTKPPTVYHSHVISYSVRFLSLSCLAWPWMILYWNVKEYVLGLRQLVPFPDDRRKFHKFVASGNFSIHHTPLCGLTVMMTKPFVRWRIVPPVFRYQPRNVVAPVWHLKECAGEWHSNQWWRQVLVYLHSRRTLKLPGKDYQTECFATRVWWTTYVRKELLHSSKFFVIPF